MSCIKHLKILIDEMEANSISNSEYDLIESLRILLENGFTSTTTNVCCTCSSESRNPYVFAGVETLLKFSEASGLLQTGSGTFYNVITSSGPVPSGSFCEILEYQNGDNFSPFIDSTKPTNGVVNTQGFSFYTNQNMTWLNGSSIRYLKYSTEQIVITGCCSNIYASVETFLKYAEAYGLTNGGQEPLSINDTRRKYNCCDFRSSVDSLVSLTDVEGVDRFLDRGITEIGETNIDVLVEYFIINNSSSQFINIFIDILVDIGIVPVCFSDRTEFFSVERYLKYAESVGLALYP